MSEDNNGKDEKGRFLPGNRFWEARSSHGRKPIFKNPEQLEEACKEYFDWVENNPLYAAEVVKFQGQATLTNVPKMRAMTIGGLCNFLDISFQGWKEYGEKPDFSELVTRIENQIRQQKFEGASAELLNPNIIARDLGLADKKEHSGVNITIQSGDADL